MGWLYKHASSPSMGGMRAKFQGWKGKRQNERETETAKEREELKSFIFPTLFLNDFTFSRWAELSEILRTHMWEKSERVQCKHEIKDLREAG